MALADRNGQAWRARDGGHAVAGAHEMIAEHVVGRPCRRDAGRDDRVEPVAVERRQQPVLAGQPLRLRQRRAVGRLGQRPFLLRAFEDLLAKERHGPVRVGGVPANQRLERCVRRAAALQVGVEPVLELVEQHLELAGRSTRCTFAIFTSTTSAPPAFIAAMRLLDRLVDVGMKSHRLPQHAESLALQRAGVERGQVVGGMRSRAAGPGGSCSSTAAMAASSSATSADVRAIGPAVSCDTEIGMMPRRLTRPTVGLRPDQAGHRRRADDAAVGFRADADGGQAGRDAPRRCRNWTRTDSDRARTGSSSARRVSSSPRSIATTGSWPTRSGWSCRRSPRRPHAAASPGRRRCAGRLSASASEPAELTMPTTSMLSFSSTGMPCRGPRTLPLRRSASSASASASAFGLISMTAFSRGPRVVDGGNTVQIRLRQRSAT